MKLAFLLMIMLLTPSLSQAASQQPKTIPGSQHIFLAYVGYSVDADGSLHHQYWEGKDLQPVVTHIDRKTGKADGLMFTNFLFTGAAVQNGTGQVKYIGVSEQNGGNFSDWQSYKNELFLPGKNISALAELAQQNPLGKKIDLSVWVALPYPNPHVFPTDSERIAAEKGWIDSFLTTWQSGGYGKNLYLAGFYWTGESEYANTGRIYDGYVMSQVNAYVHQKKADSHALYTLWIPYQGAKSWDRWKLYGFDLSILQNNYYFDPQKSFETGAANAFANGQGMEMELDLGVTWDFPPRARFLKYLNSGITGGKDGMQRSFPAYMKGYPLAWYTGGWYWYNGERDQALIRLYRTGSPLYDYIYQFIQGTYKGPTPFTN